MDTIVIPKKEYQSLLERALRFEYLSGIFKASNNVFSPPPIRDTEKIIKAFKATKLYNENFLRSLKNGLKKSSYFQNGNCAS